MRRSDFFLKAKERGLTKEQALDAMKKYRASGRSFEDDAQTPTQPAPELTGNVPGDSGIPPTPLPPQRQPRHGFTQSMTPLEPPAPPSFGEVVREGVRGTASALVPEENIGPVDLAGRWLKESVPSTVGSMARGGLQTGIETAAWGAKKIGLIPEEADTRVYTSDLDVPVWKFEKKAVEKRQQRTNDYIKEGRWDMVYRDAILNFGLDTATQLWVAKSLLGAAFPGSVAAAAKTPKAKIFNVLKYAVARGLLSGTTTPGSVQDKVKSFLMTTAFMSTTAATQWMPSDLGAFTVDMLANNNISAGVLQEITKRIPGANGMFGPSPLDKALEASVAEADANNDHNNWWKYTIKNLIPIVGSDFAGSLMTRSARAGNDPRRMVAPEVAQKYDTTARPAEPAPVEPGRPMGVNELESTFGPARMSPVDRLAVTGQRPEQADRAMTPSERVGFTGQRPEDIPPEVEPPAKIVPAPDVSSEAMAGPVKETEQAPVTPPEIPVEKPQKVRQKLTAAQRAEIEYQKKLKVLYDKLDSELIKYGRMKRESITPGKKIMFAGKKYGTIGEVFVDDKEQICVELLSGGKKKVIRGTRAAAKLRIADYSIADYLADIKKYAEEKDEILNSAPPKNYDPRGTEEWRRHKTLLLDADNLKQFIISSNTLPTIYDPNKDITFNLNKSIREMAKRFGRKMPKGYNTNLKQFVRPRTEEEKRLAKAVKSALEAHPELKSMKYRVGIDEIADALGSKEGMIAAGAEEAARQREINEMQIVEDLMAGDSYNLPTDSADRWTDSYIAGLFEVLGMSERAIKRLEKRALRRAWEEAAFSKAEEVDYLQSQAIDELLNKHPQMAKSKKLKDFTGYEYISDPGQYTQEKMTDFEQKAIPATIPEVTPPEIPSEVTPPTTPSSSKRGAPSLSRLPGGARGIGRHDQRGMVLFPSLDEMKQRIRSIFRPGESTLPPDDESVRLATDPIRLPDDEPNDYPRPTPQDARAWIAPDQDANPRYVFEIEPGRTHRSMLVQMLWQKAEQQAQAAVDAGLAGSVGEEKQKLMKQLRKSFGVGSLSEASDDVLLSMANQMGFDEQDFNHLDRKAEAKIFRDAGVRECLKRIGVPPEKSQYETAVASAIEEAKQVGGTKSAKPHNLLEELDGEIREGPHYQLIKRPVDNAVAREIVMTGENDKMMADLLRDHQLDAERLSSTVEVNGEQLSLPSLIHMYYATQNRELYLATRLGNQVSKETIDQAASIVSSHPRLKSFADGLQKLMQVRYKQLKQVLQDYLGRNIGWVENYWHIARANMFHDAKEIGDIETLLARMQKGTGVYGTTVTKSRVKELRNQSPVNTNVLEVGKHTLDMYSHLIQAIPLQQTVGKILNNNQWSKAVTNNKRFGKQYVETLQKWFRHVLNPAEVYYQREPVFTKLRQNIAKGTLFLNVPVSLLQPLSLVYAKIETGWMKGQFLKNLMWVMANPKMAEKELTERWPQLQARHLSYEFDEIVREVRSNRTTGWLNTSMQKKLNKYIRLFEDAGTKSLMVPDFLAVGSMLKSIFDLRVSQGASENDAARIAWDTVARTQPESSIHNLPEIYRSGEAWRIFLQFSSQSNSIYNLVRHDLPLSLKKDKTMALRIITANLIGGAMVWSVRRGAARLPVGKEWLEALAEIAIAPIPIAGPIAASLLRGFRGGTPVELMFQQAAGAAGYAKKGRYGKAALEAGKAGLMASGLPATGPTRFLEGVGQTIRGEEGPPIRRFFWSKKMLEVPGQGGGDVTYSVPQKPSKNKNKRKRKSLVTE